MYDSLSCTTLTQALEIQYIFVYSEDTKNAMDYFTLVLTRIFDIQYLGHTCI